MGAKDSWQFRPAFDTSLPENTPFPESSIGGHSLGFLEIMRKVSAQRAFLLGQGLFE